MGKQDVGQGDRVEYEELPPGSGIWHTVTKATDIKPPESTGSRADFSDLETPVGSKSYKPGGSGDHSACTFDLNYDPDEVTHGQILADRDAQVTQRYWRVQLRDSATGAVQATITWLGSVGKAGIGQIQRDDPRKLPVEVNVDEKPVRT